VVITPKNIYVDKNSILYIHPACTWVQPLLESIFALKKKGPLESQSYIPKTPLVSSSANPIWWDFKVQKIFPGAGSTRNRGPTKKGWVSSWWFHNPSEKYARQIGSFPQGSGWKFQKIFELPPPVMYRWRLNARDLPVDINTGWLIGIQL